EAKETAETLGLAPVNHNPYMNNVAQLIETHHVMVESIEIIDQLLDGEIDEKGSITKANCIIPTTQNNANIHHDLPELVTRQIELGKSDEEVTKLCEMLVRAYDPCISCSVH
ncbi:MAG: Ni/Fe hydrogenase subunit alpha, partial [Planctomycetota bacterium]